MITLRCPECAKEYRLDPVHLGGRSRALFRCHRCGEEFEQEFLLPGQGSKGPLEEQSRPRAASRRWTSGLVALALLLCAVLTLPRISTSAPERVITLPVLHPELVKRISDGHETFVFKGAVRTASSRTLSGVEVEISLFASDDSQLITQRVRLQPELLNAPDANAMLSEVAARRLSMHFFADA